MEKLDKGGFTLPGEAGCEDLAAKLAEKWGADAIRDSDGTELSDKLVSMGLDIYSTICLVRADNKWALANMDKLQQNYLMSFPVIARGTSLRISILDGYSKDQFAINAMDDPKEWWQVFDRTSGEEVPAENWAFDASAGMVTVGCSVPWHRYTVNFLVYRIWEEISMYNHITNNWGDREHLMAVDPIYPETQEHLLELLEAWLRQHPKTGVVRFTSMFYNFCWFWGDNPDLRFIYSDWGSYDFTASPYAMKLFEAQKGYRLESEDFVNKGLYNSTHNVPSQRYKDWMDFINSFVAEFGSRCISLVHKYGKRAYVFYDDHWIGVEPYGKRFADFKFDGIIKCVFSAFEARLCAGVKGVSSHELRLHPYLFPTGLNGEPTFKEGGNPAADARKFWVNVRRALLREPVDRIGLGGYLHLTEGFPDFNDYIGELANEFRLIKALHKEGQPYTLPFKAAVLTAWGSLRSWTCSGHMHEHPELDLIKVLEAAAGLPLELEFLSFDDILEHGIPGDVRVIINAGLLDSAWSGGSKWRDTGIVSRITQWVAQGGGFIGVGEPTAAKGGCSFFQLADVLGVDRETGQSICKMKYMLNRYAGRHFIMEDAESEPDFGMDSDNIYVTGPDTRVLVERGGSPKAAIHCFEKGRTVYFSGYMLNAANIRLLHRAICWAGGLEDRFGQWACSNIHTECAYFPGSRSLVIVNNSCERQHTTVYMPDRPGAADTYDIDAYGMIIVYV